MAVGIIGAITAILTLIGGIYAYKKFRDPQRDYENSEAKCKALEARIEVLRAAGGNANAQLADRLREQLRRERANFVDLRSRRADG